MSKTHKTKERKEAKDGEVQKLRTQVRRLEAEVRRLKSELRTYDKAFAKSVVFLNQKTEDFNLEELIEGAKNQQNISEIRQEKKLKFEDLKRKWACHKDNCDGILLLYMIPNSRYFRMCNSCDNRTEVKEYSEEPEGLKSKDLGVKND